MSRLPHILVITLSAGCLVVSGCNRPSVAESAPAVVASADRVTAAPAQRKSLELHTTQPGRIAAFEETPLFPKVSGYVEQVLVDIGDVVQRDQELIQLRVPELHDERAQMEALVAQAEAEVKRAEAALEAAKAAVATAEARVNQTRAGVGRAQGELERWQSEYQRINELAEKGSVTPKLVDETLNQLRAAEAARAEADAMVQSALAGVNEAKAKVHSAQADLVAAGARHRVAQADLKKADTMLEYLVIRAPFDGVVTRRRVDTGHFVQPANGSASEPLLVVAQCEQIRVFVDVPEMEAALVDIGDPAIVRVQAMEDREFPAKVTRTSWSLDTSNRSLRTEIDIDNRERLLRPGMYAAVTIRLDQRQNVLTLPTTAVIREEREAYCWCVESGKAQRRKITLGLHSGGEVEIVSGLADNDIVVLTRPDSLDAGQQVEVIEPGP